jgi:hypothetical protein
MPLIPLSAAFRTYQQEDPHGGVPAPAWNARIANTAFKLQENRS